MTVAVIVHLEADRGYVDNLQEKLDARLVACVLKPKSPLMAFDARLPLLLIWSKQAEARRAGPAFAAMGRLHRGQTIICVTDECPLPPSLQKLTAAVVNGSPRSSMFPGGLNAALLEAHRRQMQEAAQAAQLRTAREAASRKAFAEGMTRGLAGSVAVFGVGAAAAMGVEQFSGPTHVDAYDSGHAITAEAASEWSTVLQADDPVFAEAEVIFVEAEERAAAPSARADLADVPLGAPSPELEAARRQLGFVTDTPLQIWTPDAALMEDLATLDDGMQDAGWRPVERVIIHTDSPDATLITYGEEEGGSAGDAPPI